MIALLTLLATGALVAEETVSSIPYLVGGGVLLILLVLLGSLLTFGKGREHS